MGCTPRAVRLLAAQLPGAGPLHTPLPSGPAHRYHRPTDPFLERPRYRPKVAGEGRVEQYGPWHEEVAIHAPVDAPRVPAQTMFRMRFEVANCQHLVSFIRDDLRSVWRRDHASGLYLVGHKPGEYREAIGD